MKKKDMTALVFAAVIFLVIGYVLYSQLAVPKKATSKVVEVEVVGPITAQFDQSGMAYLNNSSEVQDFNSPVDLTELNNTEPFGQ